MTRELSSSHRISFGSRDCGPNWVISPTLKEGGMEGASALLRSAFAHRQSTSTDGPASGGVIKGTRFSIQTIRQKKNAKWGVSFGFYFLFLRHIFTFHFCGARVFYFLIFSLWDRFFASLHGGFGSRSGPGWVGTGESGTGG